MTDRTHHPDELTDDQRQRMCPSCRLRYRIQPVSWGAEYYNPIDVDGALIAFLKHAAATFDEEGELFTASEFVTWLLPDLRAKKAA